LTSPPLPIVFRRDCHAFVRAQTGILLDLRSVLFLPRLSVPQTPFNEGGGLFTRCSPGWPIPICFLFLCSPPFHLLIEQWFLTVAASAWGFSSSALLLDVDEHGPFPVIPVSPSSFVSDCSVLFLACRSASAQPLARRGRADNICAAVVLADTRPSLPSFLVRLGRYGYTASNLKVRDRAGKNWRPSSSLSPSTPTLSSCCHFSFFNCSFLFFCCFGLTHRKPFLRASLSTSTASHVRRGHGTTLPFPLPSIFIPRSRRSFCWFMMLWTASSNNFTSLVHRLVRVQDRPLWSPFWSYLFFSLFTLVPTLRQTPRHEYPRQAGSISIPQLSFLFGFDVSPRTSCCISFLVTFGFMHRLTLIRGRPPFY